MSDSHITKWALSQAMKELMAEKPMEKIKIGDIVQRCNLNRQSFYYHFKDKYDLVNWIFYTEFFAEIQDYLDGPIWDLLEKACEYFYQNRVFYRNALQFTGQNSFADYFEEVIHPILMAQCSDIFEKDPNQSFYAIFYADAIRAAISRWLLEESQISPQEFVKILKTATTGIAHKLLKDLEEEKEQ